MNKLRRNALARVALTDETVQSFYDGSHSGTEKQCLRALCESHERLRTELQGAEILLAEMESKLAKAFALTDNGSDEFKKVFPPKYGESINPLVSGWRVVGKIREILLCNKCY
jgi:hypothetical protein